MINYEEEIKLLIELQGLDSHIFRLENEFNAIPETIKEEECLFKEKDSNLKNIESNLKSLLVKRKEKEVDLESKEGVIKKYQSQMYQVKTNKEYTALQEEIGRVRADNSLIEEDILRILDQIDNENKEIAKEKEFLKQEEGKLAESKKKFQERADAISEELGRFKKDREALAIKIEKTVLSRYERLIKNRDGLALVPVVNDSCQGCFRIMPPQVINEIKMKKSLTVCEHCTRILYIEE